MDSDPPPMPKKLQIFKVTSLLPRRDSSDIDPFQNRRMLGSAGSTSSRGSNRSGKGGILSSKILIESSSPLKELRMKNKERKLNLTMNNRMSMTCNSRRLIQRGILKSSGSNMLGGTPRSGVKKKRRAVSFSKNLE